MTIDSAAAAAATPSRLRRYRKFGGVFLTTAAAQALSAVGIALLPIVGGKFADAYALAVQVGTASVGSIVLGVVYNLAIGRPDFSAWRIAKVCSALFSVFLSMLAVVLLLVSGSYGINAYDLSLLISLILYGVGGGLLATAAISGVRFACHGKPTLLPLVSVAPNAAFAVGVSLVLVVGPASSMARFLPASLWLMASAGVAIGAVVLERRTIFKVIVSSAASAGMREHATGLIFGVITSSVVPTICLVALSSLPAGSTAAVFAFSRICGSLVGLGVNSLLLVRYSWEKSADRPGQYLEALGFASLVLLSGSIVLNHLWELNGATYLMIAVAWTALLVVSAVVLREVNSRKMVRAISWKVSFDLIFASAGLLVLFNAPSVAGYFGVLLMSQVVTIAVCALYLHRRLLLTASLMIFPFVLILIVLGW